MAGIEEAFEKFSDRLAREESKRYARDEQGDYVEEVQDPYPIKLGPLELGANANMSTGKFSPNEYDNISTMNRNVELRGRYNVPDSGIALLGSIGDTRTNQNVRTDLPFNPMTGEASPYSEMRKNVYKDSPYSVGAQYNPQGTDEMYSALYNKGGGYNLGYNKGPVNVSYTSNPGLGNNVMLRGQYNFADGGRVGYAFGGMMKQALSQIGDQLAEKLPPEQQEAIVKANQSGGGIGSIFRSIISRVADVVKNKSTATPAAGLAIKLDRPVQSGDPIGSYYANPNNPALSSIAPPTTNPLTRPLSTAGFYGSEIFDILKRLGFNFADGGRVSMSEGGLTTTVPPAKGPDSQGVESLFRRRYN